MSEYRRSIDFWKKNYSMTYRFLGNILSNSITKERVFYYYKWKLSIMLIMMSWEENSWVSVFNEYKWYIITFIYEPILLPIIINHILPLIKDTYMLLSGKKLIYNNKQIVIFYLQRKESSQGVDQYKCYNLLWTNGRYSSQSR